MFNSFFFQGKTVSDDFPGWAKALCIILIVASVIFIPITALLVKFDLFKLPQTNMPMVEMTNTDKVPKSVSTAPLTE